MAAQPHPCSERIREVEEARRAWHGFTSAAVLALSAGVMAWGIFSLLNDYFGFVKDQRVALSSVGAVIGAADFAVEYFRPWLARLEGPSARLADIGARIDALEAAIARGEMLDAPGPLTLAEIAALRQESQRLHAEVSLAGSMEPGMA